MGLFDFLKRNQKIKGEIGYFGLQDWWLSELTDLERKYIKGKYQPLGDSDDSLTNDEISYSSRTAVGFLSALAGWFWRQEDRPLAHKIPEKAEDLVDSDTEILDLHFLYGEKLRVLYKDRDKTGGLDKAIDACKKQISLAPVAAIAFIEEHGDPLPSHKGFEQLAIILEKQKKYKDAIELCRDAAKQGWSGDWNKRIQRCRKKINHA